MNLKPRQSAADNGRRLAERRPLFSIQKVHQISGAVVLALATIFLAACPEKKAELIQDEAKLAGKSPNDFPQITADVFKPMDGGIELTPEEIMGRNAWNLWSAGNDHFWDHVSQDSFGLLDLLKMLDNRRSSAGPGREVPWCAPRNDRFPALDLIRTTFV